MHTSYIVRIYRGSRGGQDQDKEEQLAGVVETVDAQVRHPFHGREELWAILLGQAQRVRRPRGRVLHRRAQRDKRPRPPRTTSD